jgi:hypothetical protein
MSNKRLPNVVMYIRGILSKYVRLVLLEKSYLIPKMNSM